METGGSALASLNQWFVKCGPELAASSSPGNLNADSQAHSRTEYSRAPGWGPAACVLISFQMILMQVQGREPRRQINRR